MKYSSITFLIILTFLACQNVQTPQNTPNSKSKAETPRVIEQSNVLLLCEKAKIAETDMDLPAFEVFLQLAESKVKVADIVTCETINPEQFERYQIPSTAISAVGGWYAGAGDYLYVIEAGDQYIVKQGEMYEEKEDNDYNYQEVAKYSKSGKEIF